MDRDLRDWLRGLAAHPREPGQQAAGDDLSDRAADYLERIARDGTLKSALAEIDGGDPELPG